MLNQYFWGAREGHRGFGAHWTLNDEHPARSASGWVRFYPHDDGWFEKRGATVRKFALQEQANIFTLLNRFKDVQLDDQDGTPVADRVFRTIDGLIRATSTGLVEGRYISKASLEQLDTANLNDDSVSFAKFQNVTGPCVIGKSGSGSGDAAEISAGSDDTVARRTGGAISFGALTAAMAAANLWPFSKLQQVTGPVVLGKSGSGAGDIAEISAAADDRVFRRTGGALDFGQLTLGMAAANLWTYAKLQQVSATSRILGRKTAGAGDIEELTASDVLTILGITGSDLVYAATGADTAINSLTDVQIVSRDVTGVVAGDQIFVKGYLLIFNNSGGNATYTFTVDFDGLGDIELASASIGSDSSRMTPVRFEALIDIRATNLNFIQFWLDTNVTNPTPGGDSTVAATHLQASGWNNPTSDATGTTTVSLHIRSNATGTTQTCKLNKLEIRKVSP